jgi:hypothetical protein
MTVFLSGCGFVGAGRSTGGLSAQSGRRLAKLVEDRAMHSLEPPALGRRQILGEAKARQLAKRPAQTVESALEDGRARRRHRPRDPGGRQAPQRVGQQLPSIGLVGHLVGAHQGQRLARGDLVSLDRFEHGALLLGRQRHERTGERGAELAACELVLGPRRKARRQRQTALDPVALAPQQVRHASDRQLILGNQRMDDARFIQRGQRPHRRVGAQEQTLVGHRRRHRLDHHRHQVVSLLPPALEALEPVQDLVAPVQGHGHAQRQICSLLSSPGQRARAQPGVAAP